MILFSKNEKVDPFGGCYILHESTECISFESLNNKKIEAILTLDNSSSCYDLLPDPDRSYYILIRAIIDDVLYFTNCPQDKKDLRVFHIASENEKFEIENTYFTLGCRGAVGIK